MMGMMEGRLLVESEAEEAFVDVDKRDPVHDSAGRSIEERRDEERSVESRRAKAKRVPNL